MSELDGLLQITYAPGSTAVVKSALKAFAEFCATLPNRQPFVTPETTTDVASFKHNETTLCLFGTLCVLILHTQ